MHEVSSVIRGKFEPELVPCSLIFSRVREIMNDEIYRESWRDKNFFEILQPRGRFPKVILRNIHGYFYDETFNLLSAAEADKLLHKHHEFIVKPTLDSSGGKDVKFYLSPEPIASIAALYKKDFIIQEYFHQHKDFSVFNPSSVNIVRVMTMFIDEKPEFLLAALRIGAEGALTDWSPTKDGKGCLIVASDSDGTLMDKGVYKCGHWSDTAPSGVSLAGQKLPNFCGMVDMALKCHEMNPFFKLIAWDISVDETGEPCIIEYNVKRPGLYYYQWTNGPLFGYDPKRIQYVVDRLAGLK